MNKLPGWIAVSAFIIVAVNLLFLDFLLLPNIKKQAPPQSEEIQGTKDECGPSCQGFIKERVSQAIATVSAVLEETKKDLTAQAGKSIKTSSTPARSTTSSIKVTTYIPLGPGASTQKSEWTRVDGSEFTFDLSEYSGGKVYWEGNLRAQYTNSRCYARLFDKTNSRAVDFSEQSTDQTNNEYLTSGELMIWFGKLKYQLEIKSLNNITCYLDSPRLVVKY